MAEDGKRVAKAMRLTPKCKCGKPLIQLEEMWVDEDGTLYIFGYCEKKCQRIISTCEMIDAIREVRMTPLAEAEKMRERIM